MTEVEAQIDDLARKVARLSLRQAEVMERMVSVLRSEQARAEEERIAGLGAMTDLEAVPKPSSSATRTDGTPTPPCSCYATPGSSARSPRPRSSLCSPAGVALRCSAPRRRSISSGTNS